MKKMVMAALMGMSLVSGTVSAFRCTDAKVNTELGLFDWLVTFIVRDIFAEKSEIQGQFEWTDEEAITEILKQSKHPKVIMNMGIMYLDRLRHDIDKVQDPLLKHDFLYPYMETVLAEESKENLTKMRIKATQLIHILNMEPSQLFATVESMKK